MNYDERDPRQFDDPYTGYYGAEKRRQKKHTGLLAVLIVLAVLTAAASWAINMWDIRAHIGEDGLTLTAGDQQLGSREPDVQTQPAPAEEIQEQNTESGPVLRQEQSPAGVENIPAGKRDSLSLQEIYETSILSAASIICQQRGGTATGSGIVMSEDGYIITNYHVIDGAEQIQVLLYNEKYYSAELVGGDEPTDLAVLKIQASGLVPAQFGDSDVLRVGDPVVAIGDPLGTELRGTMTDGIVSAINRDLEVDGRHMTLIQTNAALNSGNSGGPLINCYGQVIGINTVKMLGGASVASAEGLGFAIPINVAKPIIDELIDRGYVSGRPAIGIEGITLDIRMQFFYSLPAGVMITAVEEGSDAEAKGLMSDDIIVSYNDKRVSASDQLTAAKEGSAAGDVADLVIYRKGKYYEVSVTLMDQTRPELQ
mgnify:CR=1 FL=1